uniref:Uncharacterized protein n=1 Tax=Anolis carolinensis TaxID=28377 RepID=A0A803TDP1_ANOCA
MVAVAAWLLLPFSFLFGASAVEAVVPEPLLQGTEFTFLLLAERRESFYVVAPGNGSMEVESSLGAGGKE